MQDYIQQNAHVIEAALIDLLKAPSLSHASPRLLEAMRYSVLGGGKRLRPFLVRQTAAQIDAQNQVAQAAATRVACAIEILHCYSLIHDDLPAMDDDDWRRGKPSAHKAFDEATAILAGDALLTYAFEIIADPLTHPDAQIRAMLIQKLALAAGPAGMAGGQMRDIEGERTQALHTLHHLAQTHRLKTGALISFSVEAGALVHGLHSGTRFEALKQYGAAFGQLFQIADDILDAIGDEAQAGKRLRKDQARGKATYVSLLGLQGAQTALNACLDEAQAALFELHWDEPDQPLRQILYMISQKNT